MRLPPQPGPAPLVVLVPGGGWASADPSGLESLSDEFARDGAVTATVTYSTTTDGAVFPTPVDDVACAVRWSAARATEQGHRPTRIVVAGHSAGGHLASLVALSGDRFGGSCPWPPVTIDGFVGLAGVYDIDWAGAAIEPLFGASRADAPTTWQSGDPVWWAQRPGAASTAPRVLLIHGDADEVVPVDQTTTFGTVLREAGIDVEVDTIPGVTHGTVTSVDVAGPLMTRWFEAWP
jgi:acetyl esterase/lipase